MDVTYIPMARGFLYLAAVVDWYSRRVMAWRLSISLDPAFCVEAVEEALEHHGSPEIFNTDQGSQFTSEVFTSLLKGKGIAISMDGRGSWKDNVFVERLWKSVKYEEVYLKAYGSVSEARDGLGRYFEFYNARRPHISIACPPTSSTLSRSPRPRQPEPRRVIPLIDPDRAVQTSGATSIGAGSRSPAPSTTLGFRCKSTVQVPWHPVFIS